MSDSRPWTMGWLVVVCLWLAACRSVPSSGPPLRDAVWHPAFDPAALVDGRPPEGGELPALAVRDFGPEGVADGHRIRVRFNRAVVAVREPDTHPPVAITVTTQGPDGAARVAGTSEWSAPDVLEWTPAESLPEATAFEAMMSAGLSVDGAAELPELRWSFETPRPGVVLDEPYEPLGPREPVYVYADQPVSLEALARSVEVELAMGEDAEPRPVEVRVRVEEDAWQDHAYAIEPAGRWPAGAHGVVRVAAGLRSELGPLPSDEPVSVPVRVRDRLRVLSVECDHREGRWCAEGPFRVRVSTEVPRESLAGVTVSPLPAGLTVVEGWDPDDGPTIEIDGELEPDRRYRVILPASLTDVHGQRLGRRRRIEIGRRDLPPPPEVDGLPGLWLPEERGTFARPEDARIGIAAEHLRSVRVRVVAIPGSSRTQWLDAKQRATRAWPDGTTTTEVHRLEPEGPEGHAELAIELARFGGLGDAVLLEVQPLERTRHALDDPHGRLRTVRGLYQISGLGTEVVVGPARGVARITAVDDGEPRSGVRASLRSAEGATSLDPSDAHGMVWLPGAETQGDGAAVWLDDPAHGDRLALALRDFHWPTSRGALGRDVTINANGRPSWRSRRVRSTQDPPAGLRRGERALVAIETGRGVVLPSDTLRLVGWAGISTPYGELSTRRVPEGTPVSLEVTASKEVLVVRKVDIDSHGRFVAEIPVPPDAPLGMLLVRATLMESTSATSVMLADTRIPTFELAATMARAEVVRGAEAMLHARARHLSGEPTPLEAMRWVMTCHDGWFHPGDEEHEWSFGVRGGTPWFHREGLVEPDEPRAHLVATLATDELDPLHSHSCSIAVAGQDASLQQVGADTDVFVHPASVYLGLRPPPDADEGEALRILAKAVDIHGERVERSGVTLTVAREQDERLNEPETQPVPEIVASCTFDLPGEGDPAVCEVGTLPAGRYLSWATATVDGVPVRTEASFHVEPPPPPPIERTPPSTPPSPVAIASERARPFELHLPRTVRDGQEIEVAIEAPWEEGRGMLTVGRTGLRDALPFALSEGRATVRVEPGRGQGPRLELRASVARPAEGGRHPRIEQTSGSAWVEDERELELEIEAPHRASPGTTVPLLLRARDSQGRPVDARVALWVVDEGLHQLRSPVLAPLPITFDPDRPSLEQRTRGYDELLRPFVRSGWRARRARAPRVRQARAQVKGALELQTRTRFEPVPLFVGNVGTGPDGELRISLPLPDDLTRFHVRAVASAELGAEPGSGSGPARFGRAHAQIEVRAPLMVRAVLPRVLRPGDRAEVAALVTPPEGGGELEVELEIDGDDGALVGRGPSVVRRTVEGAAVVRVGFQVEARAAGMPRVGLLARFVPTEGRATLGGVRRPLPVEIERTQIERAAIHGRVDRDEPVAIPVRVPDGARPDHGSLSLSVRSSMLGELDEAARYLMEYPYGCLEQTASRLVPLVALGRLRDRLPADAGDPDAMIAEGLARLRSMQLPDGRFGYWPGDTEPALHAGAYATWVMTLAADAGHPVPERVLDRALDALLAGLDEPLPSSAWGREEARAERAVAVHVLVSAGRRGPSIEHTLDDLVAHRDELPPFGRAMLLMAAHGVDAQHERVDLLRRGILASLERASGAAYPVEPVHDRWGLAFDSRTRSHALVLMAMLRVDPDDPVVDELARGLRRRQEGGRWGNTQENAYGLLALAEHAGRRESIAPDHRLEVWLGPTPARTVEQRGRDARPVDLRVAMNRVLGPLGSDRTTTVVIDRHGEGAAYYRLGMEWVADREPPERAQGMRLTRRLLARDGTAMGPGTDPLRAGERYSIEVTIDTDVPQHYLAIEVPLPAGLEAVDSTLGAGLEARVLPSTVRAPWVSHQELHRDRVLVFADSLPPGRHVHRVPVLAATPGRYVLPPAVAEAMYTPEIRARTTRTRVRVDPRR